MKEEKLGQEFAFPNTDGASFCTDGMSKRFYAACMAMQGLITHGSSQSYESMTQEAYGIADEILKQEIL